jgi:hypothetical protein
MTAKPLRAEKAGQGDGIPANLNATINKWTISPLVILTAFPLIALGIYCANLPADGLMAYGAAVMVSGASFLAGSLLGFLFGIPRALSSGAEATSDEQHDRLISNTNLEEISDWLTKIIVGATLVQLGSLPHRFAALATSVSSIFGSPSAQNKTMAGAIILYSAIFGFFALYVAARTIITLLFSFSPSDMIPSQQHIPVKQVTSNVEESQAERPDSELRNPRSTLRYALGRKTGTARRPPQSSPPRWRLWGRERSAKSVTPP